MNDEQITTHFNRSEFVCNCGCNRGNIKDDLVKRLQKVRDELGEAIVVTSGIRCEKYNGNIGSPTSSHVTGYAADLKCGDSGYRQRLLKAVMPVFNRVGISKNFVHVDVDPSKVAGVVWLY